MNFQGNYNDVMKQFTGDVPLSVDGYGFGTPGGLSKYGDDGQIYHIAKYDDQQYDSDGNPVQGFGPGYRIAAANTNNGNAQYVYGADGNYQNTDSSYKNGQESFMDMLGGYWDDVAPFVLGSLAMYGGMSAIGGMGGAEAGLSGMDLAADAPTGWAQGGGGLGGGSGGFGYDGAGPMTGQSFGGDFSGAAQSALGGSSSAGQLANFSPMTAGTIGGIAGGAAGGAGGAALGAGAATGSSVPQWLQNAGSQVGGALAGMGLKDAIGLGTGIYDKYQQGQAAQNQLDFMGKQFDYIKSYGGLGSPERGYLEQTLAAKDAASGRNSQYGPRAVELEAKLAQPKLQAVGSLTSGVANNYANAFNQDASSAAGLGAQIGKMLGNPVSGSVFGNNGLNYGGQTNPFNSVKPEDGQGLYNYG